MGYLYRLAQAIHKHLAQGSRSLEMIFLKMIHKRKAGAFQIAALNPVSSQLVPLVLRFPHELKKPTLALVGVGAFSFSVLVNVEMAGIEDL